jgi:hypothetical protein
MPIHGQFENVYDGIVFMMKWLGIICTPSIWRTAWNSSKKCGKRLFPPRLLRLGPFAIALKHRHGGRRHVGQTGFQWSLARSCGGYGAGSTFWILRDPVKARAARNDDARLDEFAKRIWSPRRPGAYLHWRMSLESMDPKAKRSKPKASATIQFRSPVVVLAGGADRQDRRSNESAKVLFLSAFSGFAGTVISGGTTSGIAGVAGAISDACPDALVVGYVPRKLGGAKLDSRYSRIRVTAGREFSVAECLQYWTDLVSSGVDPATVTVFGWGGGQIAALEYRIALTVGARVGIISGSGRSADAMKRDRRWSSHPHLSFLRPDAATVRAFGNRRTV